MQAHWGYVVFTLVNFLMTIGGLALVDRKGRKFLLTLGTAGIIVSLIGTGCSLSAYRKTANLDVRAAVQSVVNPDQTLTLRFDAAAAGKLLAVSGAGGNSIDPGRASLVVIYSYGDFTRRDQRSLVPTTAARRRSRSRAQAACLPTR